MSAIWAWLVGVVTKDVMQFLVDFVRKLIAQYQKQKNDHQTAVNQAAQDSKPAENLPPTATSGETNDAINSELGHL